MKLRGFTLMEMIVAATIGAILIGALTTSVVQFQKVAQNTRHAAVIDSDAKVLSEYFSTRLQGVGGAALRPWASIFLEQGASGESDTLTLVDVDLDAGECIIPVMSSAQTNGTVAVSNSSAGACCLNDSWAGRQAYITDSAGAGWRHVQISGVDTGDCEFTFSTGVIGIHDDVSRISSFNNGVLGLSRPFRYKQHATEPTLQEEYVDPETGAPAVRDIAPNVYNIQFGFGFDSDPADGVVRDNPAGADEWYGNNSADTLTPFEPSDLRRVSIGFVIGDRGKENPTAISVLDGKSFKDEEVYYRGLETKITFRNLFIFQ